MHISTPLADMELEDRRDARTYSRAMLLKGAPRSPEAIALVDLIVDEVIAGHIMEKQQRPTNRAKRFKITGAFLSDLLLAASTGRWSKLETNTNALSRLPGGKEAFKVMRGAMGAAGLLEELPGYQKTRKLFGNDFTQSARTSFRPTPKLMATAAEMGVDLTHFASHFSLGTVFMPDPVDAVEIRAQRVSEGTVPKRLPMDLGHAKASKVVADLQRLNAHLLADGRIEGITFAGLRRIYSNADRPDFAWQWLGRYFSMPDADHYERMEGGSSARLRAIRIDGEVPAEVDISASHLTILHGLLGIPFDGSFDPYDVPWVERDQMKLWLLYALGASDAAAGGRKFSRARKEGLARYPFLSDLPSLGITTLDLQFHEAEILRLAMEELMDQHAVGFLPIHDALMVAQRNVGITRDALRGAFNRYFLESLGLPVAPVPRLKVHS